MLTTFEERLAENKQNHREHVAAMTQRIASDHSIKAFLRVDLGWSKGRPKVERDAIAARAAELLDIGDKIVKAEEKTEAKHRKAREKAKKEHKPEPDEDVRKFIEGEDDPVFRKWQELICAIVRSRRSFEVIEARTEKAMDEIARTFPEWPWWEANVFSTTAYSLAVIIAEAGALSNYPAPYPEGHPKYGQARRARDGFGCLWKRMSLAVIGDGKGTNDMRQGALGKDASKAAWMAHGYVRRRRSLMWRIGNSLIKQEGPYRELYLRRKDYECAKAEEQGLIVCPAAKIPKDRNGKIRKEIMHLYRSHGHVDRMAQRYIEKRLLKDLLKASRRAFVSMRESARMALPAAHSVSAQAEAGVHSHRDRKVHGCSDPGTPSGESRADGHSTRARKGQGTRAVRTHAAQAAPETKAHVTARSSDDLSPAKSPNGSGAHSTSGRKAQTSAGVRTRSAPETTSIVTARSEFALSPATLPSPDGAGGQAAVGRKAQTGSAARTSPSR